MERNYRYILTKLNDDLQASEVNIPIGFPSEVQLRQLKSDAEVWFSPDRLSETKQRLIEAKAAGKYPRMDPHDGYGDPDIDAHFIASCNCLHINPDNGISVGYYIWDEKTQRYISKPEKGKLHINENDPTLFQTIKKILSHLFSLK